MAQENTEMTKAFFSSLPPAIRVLLIVFLVFSLARYFVDGFALEITLRSRSQGFDLQTYYLAASMLRNGENIYDLDRARELAQRHPSLIVKDVAPYLYPPFLAIVMRPLSYLPFPWAYRVWILCQQFFLIGSLLFLAKSLPALGDMGLPLLVILATNMYPIYIDIALGQVDLLILFALCLALYLIQRDRFFWAGALIGLAGMIKISPMLLIGFFVLQRKWRILAGTFIALTVLVAFSLAIVGTQTMLSFFSVSLAQSIPDQISWMYNLSPAALIHRLHPTLGGVSIELPVRWASALACLGILVALSLKQRSQRELAFTLLFSLWITATLLISPITWEQHLVMLLPAFGAAAAALIGAPNRLGLWLSGGLAMVYVLVAFEHLVYNRFDRWWEFTGSYLHDYFFTDVRLLGLISLFALLVILLRRVQCEAPAPVEAPQ